MKTLNKKLILLAFPLLLLTLLSTADSNAAEKAVTPPKTRCFIEVEDPHISTYILKKEGRLAVKVNAISRCNVVQSRVTLTVKIFKKTLGLDQLLKQKSTNPDDPHSQGQLVRNTSTYVYCKNTKQTAFYGVASAQAYIGGKRLVTVPAFSENPVVLKCGT